MTGGIWLKNTIDGKIKAVDFNGNPLPFWDNKNENNLRGAVAEFKPYFSDETKGEK